MPSFDLLAPPFFAACAVLCATGFFKVWRPAPTARALRLAGLPSRTVLVRLLGGLEVSAGAGGLFAPGPISGTAVGVLYLGFAAFLVFALARDLPIASCGCAGVRDLPPSWLHVALDLVASAAAFALAVSTGAPTVGVAGFVENRPLVGTALAVGALLIAWLSSQVVLLVPAAFASYRGSVQR